MNIEPRVLDHPLSEHILAGLRDVSTPPDRFRRLARTLSSILILEATRIMQTELVEIETPLEKTSGRRLKRALAVVPILRAGLSMLEPALDLFPEVAVGYIGMERDESTARAHSYYCKLPNLENKFVMVVDPMLATGGSAAQAITLVKEHLAERVSLVTVVAAPEGIGVVQKHHPEVPIISAAIDRELNEQKYILPGLGDFGDRLYGTD